MAVVADAVLERQASRAAKPVDVTGRSYPLGATLVPGAVNFSLFSRSAAAVELLLFDRLDDAKAARVVPFDPVANHTYHYWHIAVPAVEPRQIYGFRVHGPFDPQ